MVLLPYSNLPQMRLQPFAGSFYRSLGSSLLWMELLTQSGSSMGPVRRLHRLVAWQWRLSYPVLRVSDWKGKLAVYKHENRRRGISNIIKEDESSIICLKEHFEAAIKIYQKAWKGTHLNRPWDSLRLPSKPPRETQRIINLSQALRNRFSRLISNNLRQIFLILSNQRIPFQKPLSTGPGIDFLERLKGCVGGLNGCIYIGCIVIGCCGPYFTSSGI